MEEPWDFNWETNELNFNVLFRSGSFALEKGRAAGTSPHVVCILFLFLHLHYSVGNERSSNLYLQPCHRVCASWDSQGGSAAVGNTDLLPLMMEPRQERSTKLFLCDHLCVMQTGIEGINLSCRLEHQEMIQLSREED